MKELKFLPEFLPKIKSGEKTCTRRPIKPQPPKECKYGLCDCNGEAYFSDPEDGTIKFPYGKPGTIYTIEYGTQIRIKKICAERVQDISESDCFAEGIEKLDKRQSAVTTILRFKRLWNSIYAVPKPIILHCEITHYESYPWSKETRIIATEINGLKHFCYHNPFVWVIDFEVVK